MRAIDQIQDGLSRYPLWLKLAMTDIRQTYKRSVIGLAWIALSFAIFITAKIVVFGKISPVDPKYFSVWLTVGFWLWVSLSASIVEGTNVFIHSRTWILSTRIPLTVFVFQSIARIFIRSAFSAPVVFIVMLVMGYMPTWDWVWSALGLLVIIVNAAWVQLLLGVLCVKFRDLTHLVMAFVHVMFFLTPILYTPDQFEAFADFFNYNPFVHYIALVREPIVAGGLPVFHWQVVIVMTVIGWGLAISALQGWGRRIPFWV